MASTDPVELVRARIDELAGGRPVVTVALDGRGGAGKSTLARRLADLLDRAVVVEGDDFYAGGTEAEWRAMTPADRAGWCMDWRRQRPVLEALRAGRPATWRPFDWAAFDGRLEPDAVRAEPAPVVVLEGVYSARPELADLLDLRVLLDPPEDVRRAHLLGREGDAYVDEWEALWASAEEHYFGTVMPHARFDLIVDPMSGT